MTDTADFVPRRSARVASQKRDADEPIAKPAPAKSTASKATKNGTAAAPAAKKAKTEAAPAVLTLQVGDELPEVVLKDQDGNDVNISDISKTSTVVIFGMIYY